MSGFGRCPILNTVLYVQVVDRLVGELPLPWEKELSPLVVRQLGVLRGPVMQLLQREPSERISMDRFHAHCSKVFSGHSADATLTTVTNHVET